LAESDQVTDVLARCDWDHRSSARDPGNFARARPYFNMAAEVFPLAPTKLRDRNIDRNH